MIAHDTRAGIFGEYIGVTSTRETIHPIWTDLRDGDQNTYTASVSIGYHLPELVYPQNGDTLFHAPPYFFWAPVISSDSMPRYRIELSTDSSFEIVDQFAVGNLSENYHNFPDGVNLQPGVYYWRVIDSLPNGSLLGQDIVSWFEIPQVPVASVTPTQNELNVPPSTSIMATFDIDMNQATLDTSTFRVYGLLTGFHTGSVSYDGQSRTVILDPESDFEQGEIVTAILTTGIESSAGNPLVSGYVWSFTVAIDSGTGTFLPDSVYPVGDYPYSICAADLDGDGDIDLMTANQESDNVSVLLNNGSGTFAPQSTYEVGNEPSSMTAADVDGDGNIDLVVTNRSSHDVSVLRGSGDGTFHPDATFSVDSYPASVTAADLNGDGWIDLATANYAYYFGSVSVLINSGNGTFLPHEDYISGYDPSSVVAADLDNDGSLDLAVANSSSHTASVLLNYRDGTFAPPVSYMVGYWPTSVIAADVDADGSNDLAVSNLDSYCISILRNNGDGAFIADSTYATGDASSVVAADLDADGGLDLTATNLVSSSLSALLNEGNGIFAPQTTYEVGAGPRSVAAADLDGDGDIDLATASSWSDSVSVLLNQPPYVCGDVDDSGDVDIDDVVYLINYIFAGGPPPDPYESGDANCAGGVDIDDVVWLIAYIFSGGNAPCDTDGDEVPDC
jgi:hypothetical protein